MHSEATLPSRDNGVRGYHLLAFVGTAGFGTRDLWTLSILTPMSYASCNKDLNTPTVTSNRRSGPTVSGIPCTRKLFNLFLSLMSSICNCMENICAACKARVRSACLSLVSTPESVCLPSVTLPVTCSISPHSSCISLQWLSYILTNRECRSYLVGSALQTFPMSIGCPSMRLIPAVLLSGR